MQNKNILTSFKKLNIISKTVNLIKENKKNIYIKNLYGASKSLFAASLMLESNRRYIILAPNKELAEEYLDDLDILLYSSRFNFLLQKKNNTRIKFGNNTEFASLIDNAAKFKNKKASIAVATPDTFGIMFPKIDTVENYLCSLKKMQVLDIQSFATQLSLNGFQKEQYVSKQGEYSIRGGIMDVFAPNMKLPLRIELWGDEIESLRFFDILTQRSTTEVSEVEFINSIFVDEKEYVGSSLYEYIPEDTIFIIDSAELIDFTKNNLDFISNYQQIKLNSLGEADILAGSVAQPRMHASVQRFASELQKNLNLGIETFVSADGDIHLRRIKDLVESVIESNEEELFEANLEFKFETAPISNIDFNIDDIIWSETSLSSGFLMQESKLAYFVENEIFSRQRNKHSDKTNIAKSITLRELKQLNIGDYIVHEDKGIGKFDGFQSIEIGGNKQDCLRMLFEDNDVLYVHLNYLYKVQKYSAADGIAPKLSKLGSSEWTRKKDRTKRRLKDIARDLILLYAKRKMQKAYAFPADGTWQKEFEASFIYEDTIDQAKATIEIKRDMESETSMDRLVCGDVGFGKTEVAMRAAFKSAVAGKQVVMLVPTTILAQQHYFSFIERMEKYPIKIEVLSRFRSKSEQKAILQNLKLGKIDIIIGTHRLLSKDVEFKNLGLLIIDEEHRFGVSAKEKLRQIKSNIDTLTLTATPIPRTLNFSLMGARDLSQIETPPRNRLPIITEIEEWDVSFIINIINKEVKRGGQIFIVNDKISGLDKIAMDLEMSMPSLRIAEVHGQMRANQIEDIMEKFIEKKIDVLLSTKIIESGIDIPNANTIIINNAHNFGLAELYQLRGRVGRSNIQAYCYLIVPNVSQLSANSLQRLLAIEEFTDLGSGLQLAMRDLEIRGSGDLLGAEQSGFITDIGFDLYQKVLAEAVAELKREEFSELFDENTEENILPELNSSDIVIETGEDTFFPPDYILDDTERFNYYKSLFNAKTNSELRMITEEIVDRYGKLPSSARELIFAVKLRISALDTGFTRVIFKRDKMVLDFPRAENKDYYEKVFPVVLDYIQTYENIRLVQNKDKLTLVMKISNREEITDFLWHIKKNIKMSF